MPRSPAEAVTVQQNALLSQQNALLMQQRSQQNGINAQLLLMNQRISESERKKNDETQIISAVLKELNAMTPKIRSLDQKELLINQMKQEITLLKRQQAQYQYNEKIELRQLRSEFEELKQAVICEKEKFTREVMQLKEEIAGVYQEIQGQQPPLGFQHQRPVAMVPVVGLPQSMSFFPVGGMCQQVTPVGGQQYAQISSDPTTPRGRTSSVSEWKTPDPYN